MYLMDIKMSVQYHILIRNFKIFILFARRHRSHARQGFLCLICGFQPNRTTSSDGRGLADGGTVESAGKR